MQYCFPMLSGNPATPQTSSLASHHLQTWALVNGASSSSANVPARAFCSEQAANYHSRGRGCSPANGLTRERFTHNCPATPRRLKAFWNRNHLLTLITAQITQHTSISLLEFADMCEPTAWGQFGADRLSREGSLADSPGADIPLLAGEIHTQQDVLLRVLSPTAVYNHHVPDSVCPHTLQTDSLEKGHRALQTAWWIIAASVTATICQYFS